MKRAVLMALRRAAHRGVGLVVGLALVAGCGGGGEQPLAKAEYLKRAKTICREGNQELAKASQEAFKDVKQGEKPTAEQLKRYAREVVVPMVRKQVEELRDLPGPKGAADQVDEIYDAFEKALDRIDKQPSLLTDNPNVFEVFKEADELSRKYGFPVCT
ncbi:MAG TPA: hypothetical protein VGL92_09160 [Acidimicrobiia bacterium]|jgi:hypothetical protein